MPDALSSLHQRFQGWITHRYFVRLHMTVMLSGVVLSGVLASRLLHAVGLRWLIVRYPIAVAFSYCVFFLLVRLWLAYAVRVRKNKRAASSLGRGNLVPDGSYDFSGGGFSGVSSGGSSGLTGGGGQFGGGGASASFDQGGGGDASARMVALPVSHSSGGSGSGSGGSLDLDIDDDGAIILIVFVLVVGVVFGAGVYLVYQAPAILSEAAFQGAMAAGLVKTSCDMHEEGWMESVFKATRIPFFLSFAGAIAFGWVAHHYCPQGSTLREVFRSCVFH